ncbi:MAG: lytic transglycosylase domain-containing protein [Pseudobdellovibrio sp.]|nr:lytic transglycosylase domain-containing protein [Pseudobdellovibrio sp.]
MKSIILDDWLISRIMKKLVSLLFAISFFFYFVGCNHKSISPDMQISEKIRERHAKELLKSKYKESDFKEFQGDKEFALYIKQYLEKANPKLGSDKFVKAVFAESKQYEYDPIFLMAVIKTESQFNERAIGTSGEVGLMQIKPDTAKWICKKKGVKWKGPQALKNPEYNIKVSALYFKYLKKTLDSKSSRYVNAYNMGIGRLGRLPAEDISAHPYYHKVIKNYTEIYDELKKIKASRAKQAV